MDDWARFDAMTEEERHQAAMSDPDAIPMTEEELDNAPVIPYVRGIRRALGLTQEEFSRRNCIDGMSYSTKGNQSMAISRQRWYTVEEYHTIEEENSNCKFEYIDGEVRAMAGETYEHMKIAVNLVTILNIHLEDSVCQVVNSDIHILPTSHDNPSYLPNVTVTCNSEDYQRGTKAIRFPSLIVEVLSQSTELIDRNEKLKAYQACPSMQEYLMASTQRRAITAYRRGKDGEWNKTVYTAQDTIPLVTIDLNVPMSTIYRRTGID